MLSIFSKTTTPNEDKCFAIPYNIREMDRDLSNLAFEQKVFADLLLGSNNSFDFCEKIEVNENNSKQPLPREINYRSHPHRYVVEFDISLNELKKIIASASLPLETGEWNWISYTKDNLNERMYAKKQATTQLATHLVGIHVEMKNPKTDGWERVETRKSVFATVYQSCPIS